MPGSRLIVHRNQIISQSQFCLWGHELNSVEWWLSVKDSHVMGFRALSRGFQSWTSNVGFLFLPPLPVPVPWCQLSLRMLGFKGKSRRQPWCLCQNSSWVDSCQLWWKCGLLECQVCSLLLHFTLGLFGPCHSKSNNGNAGIAGYSCHGYRCPARSTSLLI